MLGALRVWVHHRRQELLSRLLGTLLVLQRELAGERRGDADLVCRLKILAAEISLL